MMNQTLPAPRRTHRARWPIAMLAAALAPLAQAGLAEDVVGSWQLVSHVATFQGHTIDSQAALRQIRPCVADIVYVLTTDQSFRLDASASNCDAQYKSMQEKLYAKTKWKLEGNRLTTSSTNFAAGQTYTVTVSGKRMTWVGTDGQGTLVYQRK
jgi:hypothetical protein